MLDEIQLNKNQRRAVNWNKGPLLVLAGPGSGKTLVLTLRIAKLIKDSPDKRFNVLGLTFTTKAADEMRGRVDYLLGPDARRVHLSTFHSFCAEVLRQHGSHLGLKPDFEILTQDEDRFLVLDEAITRVSSGDMPRVDGRGIVKMIDHLLREGFDGKEETPLPFPGHDKDWIRPIFSEYMAILIENNHLDFGTLLGCCLRLFKEKPRIIKHYRIVYPYVCVDEYQDTNKVQDLLLRALCGDKSPNLFVVADDDQIIYQWNGASPERLKQLRMDYKMTVIQLPESYRCPAPVIELANNLIEHNIERSPNKKTLVATSHISDSNTVRIRRFNDYSEEMSWIAKDISERSLEPEKCAVLARNTKLLLTAADALSSAGLSSYLVKRKNEFESAPLRFAHSALRLANAPLDREQLQQLCKAFFELTGEEIRVEQAEAESAVRGGSLLRGFLDAAQSLSRDTDNWWKLLETLRGDLLERLKYDEFVKVVFEWSEDQRNRLGGHEEDYADEIDEISIWNELKRNVRQQFGSDPTLSQFLQEIDLRPKITPPKANDIQCLTIHLAKGKEFQHVYLAGLVEDQLPSFYAKQKGDDSREIEEERRNCFVAITRVQTSLTLTFADSYFGWEKEPSRFLYEMGIDIDQVE